MQSLASVLATESTRRNDDTETVIDVTVAGRIIVTVGGAAAIIIVVPRTAAQPEVAHPAFTISA